MPDDICTSQNFDQIRHWYAESSQIPNPQSSGSLGHKCQEFRLHCFASIEMAAARQFQFGGEMFDPAKEREKGRAEGLCQRDGTWFSLLASGPLNVPPILRD